MFKNCNITISSQDENRNLTNIYTNIPAQTFKKTLSFNARIAENTVKEVTIFYIDPDKKQVKEWNIIQYKDKFWFDRLLKITNIEFIDATYFKKVIELKCDLV